MELKFRNLKANEIEIRRGRSLKDGRCELLCYKTYSVDCAILDETVGPDNWVVNYKREGDTLLGGIAIWSDKHNAFLWKWAAGAPSDYESIKGEQSDALKRAGFVWNIGRTNLCTAPRVIVKPESDYTTYYVEEVDYDETGKMKDLVLKDNKGNTVFSYHNFKVDFQSSTAQAQPKYETTDAGAQQFVKDNWDKEDKHLLSAFYNACLYRKEWFAKFGVLGCWRFFKKDYQDGKFKLVLKVEPGVNGKKYWTTEYLKKDFK